MSDELQVSLSASVGELSLAVELSVARGPIVVVGPNGAGKSTLLRALAGAVPGVRGRIEVRGRVLQDSALGVSLPPAARRVGYLPQGYGLFAHLTAQDNVAYGMRDVPRSQRRAAAVVSLAQLGVAHVALRRPAALSGGEAQRVALARALATRPDLLLLDEPTAALDVGARREVRDLLAQTMASEARCSVVVSHDLRDLLAWGGTVVVLVAGRVVVTGSVESLADCAHPFVRELVAPLAAR